MIHKVRAWSGEPYKPETTASDDSILNFCEAYPVRRPHDPNLHGSFEFREEHWYVPEFMNNRVMIPDDAWDHIVWEANRVSDIEPIMNRPYAVINAWCREHCVDQFAWVGAAITWTFRNPNDALAFKLRWA